jgi:hypothetical protein
MLRSEEYRRELSGRRVLIIGSTRELGRKDYLDSCLRDRIFAKNKGTSRV